MPAPENAAASKEAGPELERFRGDQLRSLHAEWAIVLLTGPADYLAATGPPRAAGTGL